MILAIAQTDHALMPFWLAGALTGLLCAVLWWHIGALLRADMPDSRRRIRLANAAVTAVLAPVLGLSFGVVHPGLPALWVLCWSVTIALLALTVLLAAIDTVNNVRLHHAERQDLLRDLAAAREAIRKAAAPRPRPSDPGLHE